MGEIRLVRVASAGKVKCDLVVDQGNTSGSEVQKIS